MDLDKIEKIIKLMRNYSLHEFEWEGKQEKIKLKQNPPPSTISNSIPHSEVQTLLTTSTPTVPITAASGSVSAKKQSKHKEIRSPFVGTFYIAPSPGADHFVRVGQKIKKGDTLCIVEAMKLMNEIEAESNGVIKEIMVENEEPVEYDQVLFLME